MIADSRINIDLTWSPPHVDAVQLKSSRNTDACRVFEKKSVSEALKLVPLLFSICGRAQAVAGLNAVEQVEGIVVGPDTRQARTWLIRMEAAQEYLWRLLVDLPKCLGMTPDMNGLANLRQRLHRSMAMLTDKGEWLEPGRALAAPDADLYASSEVDLRTCLESEVLGIPVSEWRSLKECTGFDAWLQNVSTPVAAAIRQLRDRAQPNHTAIPCLPADNRVGWLDEIADALASIPGYAQTPLWRGGCHETGALARCHDRSLIHALRAAGEDLRLVRLVARLIELTDTQLWLSNGEERAHDKSWFGGGVTGDSAGYGWVETARGLLVHHVVLDGAQIERYRILAPTEWNFHPEGPLRQGLSSLQASDERELCTQAELAVLALDPCVAFEVQVNHA